MLFCHTISKITLLLSPTCRTLRAIGPADRAKCCLSQFIFFKYCRFLSITTSICPIFQDLSKQLGEANHETLGQTCSVLFTNPDLSCCDSLVMREEAEKLCSLFPGKGLQALHHSAICLRIYDGFAIIAQARQTLVVFFKESPTLK